MARCVARARIVVLRPRPELTQPTRDALRYTYSDPVTNTDIPGAFDGNPYFSRWEDVPNYFRCNDITETEPGLSQIQPQPEVSVIFWVLFTFVSAFVMLSLFVGAVTLAMSDSMDPDKDEVIISCAGAPSLKRAPVHGVVTSSVVHSHVHERALPGWPHPDEGFHLDSPDPPHTPPQRTAPCDAARRLSYQPTPSHPTPHTPHRMHLVTLPGRARLRHGAQAQAQLPPRQ